MASAVLSVNGRFLSVREDLRLFFGRKKPLLFTHFQSIQQTASLSILY